MEIEHKDVEAYQLYSYVLNRIGIHDGIINGFHQTQKDSELYLEELEILEYDMLYGDQTCYDGENPYTPTDMQMGIDPIVLTGIRAFDSTVSTETITDSSQLPQDEADLTGIPSDAETGDVTSAPDEGKDDKDDDGGFWSIFSKKDKKDAQYTMFFLGSGFTPYSYIQVDGEEINTMFVSDTVLSAVMPLPEAGAEITVVQHGPDEQILSSCEPLIITEQLLKNMFPKENPALEGED